GDGRLRRDWTDVRATAAQLLVPLVTIAKVADDSRKALQRTVFLPQGHGDVIGPKSRPAFSEVPGFVSQMAFGGCPLQVCFKIYAGSLFAGIEEGHMLANGLIAFVAVNAFRARIPGDNPSVHIQQEKRTIPHP